MRHIASFIDNIKRRAGDIVEFLRSSRTAAQEHPAEPQHTTARMIALYLQIWMYQLIAVLIFAMARIVYLSIHTTHSERMENIDSLPLFLYNTFRFDMQAATYIAVPMIVAALIISFTKSEKAAKRMCKVMRHYFAITLALVALIAIAEFYYYDNFETRYNIVFFDFFDEGPTGLMQTMWDDYPCMRILLSVTSIGVAVFLIGKLISRIRLKSRKWMGKASNAIATMLVLALTFAFLRGSVTLYTLQVEAFEVSPNEEINKSVPNALYLLKKAFMERITSFELKSDEEVLAESGFGTVDEVIAASMLKQNNETDSTAVERAIFNTVTSPDSILGEQPNVVLIMNESWSNFLLKMDKGEELDLICSLRPHLDEDLLMENIQSVENGTIYSIESTVLAMPYPHYFQSRYRFDSLKTSIAYPFLASGYNTRFISGADPTWENLNEALKVQYFEKVDGRQQILHTIEGSSTSQIGAYDEFLYEYILREMQKAAESGRPQFFMALTTTNHPPFEYPDNMHLPPLNKEWYDSRFIKGNSSVKTKYGLGAQYSNRCLGDFMTAVKQSPLRENTIVVAIGDHNVRSILNYDNVPEKYKYNVPLYIYLPPKYALTTGQKERISKRHGCHYDILPTLARYAFKQGVKYLNIGNDLLDYEKNDSSYYSYNINRLQAIDDERAKEFKSVAEARKTLMKLYYQSIFRNSDK